MTCSISLADLERLGACQPARDAFAAQFPKGVATYREVLLALADHPRGLRWWAWLAPAVPALRPAWEQYLAARLAASEQYDAAVRAARDAARDAAWAAAMDAPSRSALRAIAGSLFNEGSGEGEAPW